MLEERIRLLKKQVIAYANLVEIMMDKSVGGLLRRDKTVLHEVLEQDEPKANAYEIEIDGNCTSLVAQYAPKARDLRLIMMAAKIGNDLERMGDHAVNIAESALVLINLPPLKPLLDISRMAETATGMLKDTVTAFIDLNSELAQQVCTRDGTVDDSRNQILRELITYMTADPSTIERALHLLRISGNLERIADLSTNVCEDIIFISEGRVIKHHLDDGR